MSNDTKDVALLDYRAMTINPTKFAEIVRANTGDTGLSARELDRVKVPSGGGQSWSVPSLTGEQDVKEIQGVIIAWRETRGYWPGAYSGASDPPQCASEDGIVGIGDPGGSCAVCPLAQFGSAPQKNGMDSNAQACRAGRLLFMLRPEDLLPIVVSLPPTSLKPCRDYYGRLMRDGCFYYDVITGLSLLRDKSEGGIQFSLVNFRMVRKLNAEEMGKVANLVTAFKPLFTRTKAHPDVYTA